MVGSSPRLRTLCVTALPALIAAMLCVIVIVGGLFRQLPIFYADPVPGTTAVLMEAILNANLATAHAAIQNGADPDAPAFISRRALPGARGELTPLALAAARGDKHMARMLISAGASTRGRAAALAWCVAEARQRTEILDLLEWYGVRRPLGNCRSDADALLVETAP